MSAPRNFPCVLLVVLHVSILSLVISSSAAIVRLLCRISVKRQHLWQKGTISCLLCSAVSCGMLAQVLLALSQFVIVDSPLFLCTHAAFWRGTFEAAPRWRWGRRRGRNLVRCERHQNAQLLESSFLTCCSRLVPF